MKFEIRNSKSETSSKLENELIKSFLEFRVLNFGFVSNFDIRVSDFLSPVITPCP
jgi:hypothetical protein